MFDRLNACKYNALLAIFGLLAYTSILLHVQEAWLISSKATLAKPCKCENVTNKSFNEVRKIQKIRNHPDKRKLIVLSAMYRSGSSFLGSIFDKNPEVFYLFEPMTGFEAFEHKAMPAKLEMLKDIKNCELPYLRRYKDYKQALSDSNDTKMCFKYGICQWFMNSRMCSGKLCPDAIYDPTKSHPPQCRKQCPAPSEYTSEQREMLISDCKKAKASVVKLIRIAELTDLMPLYKSNHLDLRVVLLVREPTTMMDSRLRLWESQAKLGWGKQQDPNFMGLQRDCSRSYNSKLQSDTNSIIHDRTLIIRFEDIALDEFEMAQKIYDFVGLEMNGEVTEQLKERRKRRSANEQASLEKLNLYGTNKKKNSQSIHVLTKINATEAAHIREVCQNYIDVFEYNDRR